ncbi:kinase-like domain-containing protein [Phycomyces nitens]|nr:kinase-like domain-containing protein [Phycomyces nitens]
MSAYIPSPMTPRLDRRGVPIVQPALQGQSPRIHRNKYLRINASIHGDASIDEVRLCETPKDKSLMDAYDNFSDAVHQSYTNHIARLFSHTSPRGRSSPSRFDSIQDAPTEPLSATSNRLMKRNRFPKTERNEPYAPSPQRQQMQSITVEQLDDKLETSNSQTQKALPTTIETSNRLADTTGGSAKATPLPPTGRRRSADYDDDRPRSKQKTEPLDSSQETSKPNSSPTSCLSAKPEQDNTQQTDTQPEQQTSIQKPAPKQPSFAHPTETPLPKLTKDPNPTLANEKEPATMGPPATITKPVPVDEIRPTSGLFPAGTAINPVQKELEDIMASVRSLSFYYKLVDKIGEGTFSTVYKAIDIRHERYNNEDWEAQLISGACVGRRIRGREAATDAQIKNRSKFVALKRVYSTSSPKRIASEIEILQQLRGCPCISPLITAFRQQEEVFVVLPFIQHDEFKKIFLQMPMEDIKCYMRCMFTALKSLHSLKILHRDIKPNNFLYSSRDKTGTLIDFGLAQREEDTRPPNSSYTPTPIVTPTTTAASTPTLTPAATPTSTPASTPNVTPSTGATVPHTSIITPVSATTPSGPTKTPIRRMASSLDQTESSKVRGYMINDQRRAIRANRAGTKGFRAPEVLMRVVHQTTAIDIWSVGVIFLSILSGSYPFFLANDEADSLLEMACLFGLNAMKECASSHNRTFETNIPSINQGPYNLGSICKTLNSRMFESWNQTDLKNAIDLMNKCLALKSDDRITAAEALDHPFLK